MGYDSKEESLEYLPNLQGERDEPKTEHYNSIVQKDKGKLDERNRYLRFLHETTLGLINHLDLNDLLKAIIEGAAELVDTPHAFIYLVNPEKACMELALGIGIFHNFSYKINKGEGMVGLVWEKGQPILLNRYCEWEHRIRDSFFNEVKAALVVPLMSKTEVIGVIGLDYLEDNRVFSPGDMDMLSRFAELASLALGNAKLYNALKLELINRKQVEEALRRSEAMHRALIDAIPDTLLRMNEAGILLGTKIGKKSFLSHDLKDYTGKDIRILFPEALSDRFRQSVITALNTGKMQEFECQAPWQGKIADWEVRVVTVGDDEALLIVQDITDRKRTETKAEETRKALASMERVMTLASMSAGIAHEISQPLTSIKFATDSMLYWFKHQQNIELDELLEYLKDISVQASRMSSTINHISSIMRGQHFSGFSSCNLNHAVEAALKRLGTQLKFKDIRLKKDLADGLPMIPGEINWLEQVIVNLLANSIQALEVKQGADKEIIISTRMSDLIILEIEDNGAGITPDFMDKIFDPFFTTKPFEDNMGLGLFLVHSMVTMYGGMLYASNNERGGATFRVEFSLNNHLEERG